ncbi:MAG TPA: hypothetical protein VFU81_14615, partial [Thermomicrobiales bacterium]|nr:hypothetical protein [Thermomicrobiales bacterium]
METARRLLARGAAPVAKSHAAPHASSISLTLEASFLLQPSLPTGRAAAPATQHDDADNLRREDDSSAAAGDNPAKVG